MPMQLPIDPPNSKIQQTKRKPINQDATQFLLLKPETCMFKNKYVITRRTTTLVLFKN